MIACLPVLSALPRRKEIKRALIPRISQRINPNPSLLPSPKSKQRKAGIKSVCVQLCKSVAQGVRSDTTNRRYTCMYPCLQLQAPVDDRFTASTHV
jgi:hypothetical protein